MLSVEHKNHILLTHVNICWEFVPRKKIALPDLSLLLLLLFSDAIIQVYY